MTADSHQMQYRTHGASTCKRPAWALQLGNLLAIRASASSSSRTCIAVPSRYLSHDGGQGLNCDETVMPVHRCGPHSSWSQQLKVNSGFGLLENCSQIRLSRCQLLLLLLLGSRSHVHKRLTSNCTVLRSRPAATRDSWMLLHHSFPPALCCRYQGAWRTHTQWPVRSASRRCPPLAHYSLTAR